MKGSYLTYAMSVIVSRALPDVRDGLKPSQRRILVAMNDLNLSPGGSTSKCAGIVGETMKRYHPHGDQAIYPTLVRLAQEWNTRYPLLDKQGNFGSVAGLPPAAMRYTEARMSPIAAIMLEDYKLDTVELCAHLRRKEHGADSAAVAVSQPAGKRLAGDCGGHGDLDSAAQSGRDLRLPDPRHRRP